MPGCTCEPAETDEQVCGADGNTYDNACHALCRAVPVMFEGPCVSTCSELSAYEAPCYGLRRIDADGCPTCECAPDLPETAADCSGCPIAYGPVCGSDGVTYWNRCHARCSGVRLLYAAACADGCRSLPEGCELDCDWGFQLGTLEDECLTCACAPGPWSGCVPAGAPVCVELGAFRGPVTVGSPCLAGHMGASDGLWGPCGTACDDERPCADGLHCQSSGPMAGRCLSEQTNDCGCPAIDAPVCATDETSYANACHAWCAGLGVVHEGECCAGDGPQCDQALVPQLDVRGCPFTDADTCAAVPDPVPCLDEQPLAKACSPGGASVEGGSACAAHANGIVASTQWCSP